jgi:hypothetical protein
MMLRNSASASGVNNGSDRSGEPLVFGALPNMNGSTPEPKLVVTLGIKAANYEMTLNQYQNNGKTVGSWTALHLPTRYQSPDLHR